VPDPSLPKTFEDYLWEVMARSRVPTNAVHSIGLHSRGYGIVLALPRADGEDLFSVDGNTVAPLTEPKGG
jgi:hypothetical protein